MRRKRKKRCSWEETVQYMTTKGWTWRREERWRMEDEAGGRTMW